VNNPENRLWLSVLPSTSTSTSNTVHPLEDPQQSGGGEGIVIGCIGAKRYYDHPINQSQSHSNTIKEENRKTFELIHLCVEQTHRRHHIGSYLIEQVDYFYYFFLFPPFFITS
jgi:hypothetical protein